MLRDLAAEHAPFRYSHQSSWKTQEFGMQVSIEKAERQQKSPRNRSSLCLWTFFHWRRAEMDLTLLPIAAMLAMT